MTRVLLLGPNGMLGTAIREGAPDDIEVVPWEGRFSMNWPVPLTPIWSGDFDCILNTIGVRPGPLAGPIWMSHMNATVPHQVAQQAQETDTPVIHVSTDCVYGPSAGYYQRTEGVPYIPRTSYAMQPDPDTLYGRTKLAGESELAINVRTSFVGPRHGLWKWFVDATESGEGEVDGWMQAWWSGSTVNAVASALLDLAREPGEPRTLHLATETPICKAEVLAILGDVLRLSVTRVNLVQEPRIDRSLHPDIVLPPFEEALREMVT